MAITPQTPGSISAPNSVGSETEGAVAIPNSLAPETAGAVVIPNSLTPESVVAVSIPNSVPAETEGAVSVPNSLSAETVGAVVVPNSLAAAGVAAFPRTFVPTLDLDFKNELYAQNGAPKSFSDVLTFSRNTIATFLDRSLNALGQWNYFVNTAASGALRIEYDQATGESLGALIESSSTNLLLRSEEFDNASWAKSSSVVSENEALAPDNSESADKIKASSTAATSPYVRQTVTTVATNSYTVSAFVKRSETSFLQITFAASDVANDPRVNFDLSTGLIGSQDADIDAASITPIGNDWFRISATVVAVGTTFDCQFRLMKTATDTRAQTNSWISGEGIFLWGAQIESKITTSYIKTEGSTVSRLADLLSAPTAGNVPLGDVTFHVDADNAGSNGVFLYSVAPSPKISGAIDVLKSLNIFNGSTAGSIAIMNDGFRKFSMTSVFTRASNQLEGFLSGALKTQVDAGTPQTADILGVLGIGNDSPVSTKQLNGHIKRLTIIDKALTAQEVSLL